MEPQIRYARTADGVRIACYGMGTGPALLVLPVLPGMSPLSAEWRIDSYRDFLLAVGLGRTAVRYDPRGLGLSERDVADLSLAGHVLDVVAVLDRLEIGRASVLAHSYAGPIGVAMAARHPERVEKLLLWCTHAGYGPVRAELDPEVSRQRQAVLDLAAVNPELALRTYTHFAAGWSPGSGDAGFADVAEAAIGARAFFSMLPVYGALDATEELRSVAAPTLVMHRPAFHGIPLSTAQGMAAVIPNARLQLYEGTSNVPFIGDNVGEIAAAMRAFLDEGVEGSRPDARLRERDQAARPDRERDAELNLTAREAEVLQLLARGYSNQQIAETLVLSVRTVERHIANAYGKIGAHNRAEATTVAIRSGLA